MNARKFLSVWVAGLAAAGGLAACSSNSSTTQTGSAADAHPAAALWGPNEGVG